MWSRRAPEHGTVRRVVRPDPQEGCRKEMDCAVGRASEMEHSPVANLSGGMRHRTSLACSMIHEPRILWLDEPTVGVDPELRSAFWQYFTALKQSGVTIIITTHYMDEAQHCDKIGLVRQGRLIADGTPLEITEETKTTNLEDAFLALSRGQETS